METSPYNNCVRLNEIFPPSRIPTIGATHRITITTRIAARAKPRPLFIRSFLVSSSFTEISSRTLRNVTETIRMVPDVTLSLEAVSSGKSRLRTSVVSREFVAMFSGAGTVLGCRGPTKEKRERPEVSATPGDRKLAQFFLRVKCKSMGMSLSASRQVQVSVRWSASSKRRTR